MNAVAFCLYGNNPKYLEGMIQNAWLMPRIYPGWECHCWFDEQVPLTTVMILNHIGVQLHRMELGWRQRMFYRFVIHDWPRVERYLIRDADSRISMRERRCVDEWMQTDKILHTIHDHPYHIRPIQGGTFGIWRARCQIGQTMLKLIGDVWPSVDTWGRDEEFLETALWPYVKHSVCEHGRVNTLHSDDDEDREAFIGEIYDANGNPAHPEHRAMRKI